MVFGHYLRYPESMAKAFYQPDMLHPNARGHVSLKGILTVWCHVQADPSASTG